MDLDMFFIWVMQWQTSMLKEAAAVIEESTADIKKQGETIMALKAENAALKLELAKARNDEASKS